jgi:hypothetical protein
VQRWKIEYHWTGQPYSYSPSATPRPYRPPRPHSG